MLLPSPQSCRMGQRIAAFFVNSYLLNFFTELQKILTASGCVHQQVCPVYPQVHHVQCPGSCLLLAEALGSTPVSFLTPVSLWLAHGELAQSGCHELVQRQQEDVMK